MQSIPTSTCLLTISATAGVTCAAMTAGSVISALASRPGMSSHPLGDGSRPTCEVLIRVMLCCMFPPPDEVILPGNGSTSQDRLSHRFNREPPAVPAADREVEPVRSRSSITPARWWRRACSSQTVFGLLVEVRRQWPLLQNVEVGLQVRRVDRADDGRVQVRVRESEAENELHRGHAVEQVIEVCLAPAFPLQPRLLSLGRCSLCSPTANDDARALLSRRGDRRFVFTLDRRVRDLEDIENTHGNMVRQMGQCAGHADKPHLAGLSELQ